MPKIGIFSLIIVGMLHLLQVQSCGIAPECKEFMSMPAQRRHEVFRASSIDKQLDMYRCAMNGQPADLGFAYDLADRGTESIPFIVARLRSEKDEVFQRDLIYTLEVLSDRGHLRGRKDVIDEIRVVVAAMKLEVMSKESQIMLEKIEKNS